MTLAILGQCGPQATKGRVFACFLTPEVHSSNSGKIYVQCQLFKKTNIKKKRPRQAPLKNYKYDQKVPNSPSDFTLACVGLGAVSVDASLSVDLADWHLAKL